VPEDEQGERAPHRDLGIAGGNTARVYNFNAARPPLLEKPTSRPIDEFARPRCLQRPRASLSGSAWKRCWPG